MDGPQGDEWIQGEQRRRRRELMITLRNNTQRRHVKRGKQDVWKTFYPQEGVGAVTDDFGFLISCDEMRIPPCAISAMDTNVETETVTYVYKGALAQEDSSGNSGVIHAGEFQYMIVGRGVRHKDRNPSQTDTAHIFRISLRPSEVGLASTCVQMRFPVAQRHNLMCVIASPDGRKKSLRILQDALIYSSILDPGHHLLHELLPGRSAWLHVIYGEVTTQDLILTEGDGVGVTTEPSVAVIGCEDSEILLIDLGPAPKLFGRA